MTPLWRNRSFLVSAWTFLVVSLPNLVAFFAATGEDGNLAARAAHLLFAAGIVLSLWPLVGSRLSLWGSLPLVVMVPFETYQILLMGKPSTIGTIGALLDTTPREALELVGGTWHLLAAALALPVIHAVVVAKARPSTWKAPAAGRTRLLVLAVALGMFVPEAAYLASRPFALEWKLLGLRLDADETFPFGLLHKTVYSAKAKLRLAHRSLQAASFDWRPLRAAEVSGPETYVIVVGESSRSGNWSLYGYGRRTTPRLEADRDLLVFRDATSGANATPESLPQILSLATAEHPERFDSSSSILSCFRQAGFKTWWLSTQGRFGVFDSKPTMIGKEADEARFLSRENDAPLHDGDLLPFLDRALMDPSPRKLVVLHTLGSHYQFDKRYPKAFERFAVTDGSLRDSGSYDNAILYTDWLLEQILSRLRARPGVRVFAFLSDHGESRGENGFVLHGNVTPPRAEFEIPFLLWTSAEWERTNPLASGRLREHLAAKVSSVDFLPTFLDMADIHSPRVDSSRSLAREAYGPRRRLARVPQGFVVDVDTLTGTSLQAHPLRG